MAARAAVLALLLLLPAMASAGEPTQRWLASARGPLEDAEAQLARAGARVLERFPSSDVLLLEAPASRLPILRALPGVANLHAEEPLTLLLSSSRPAVHAGRPLWDAGADGRGVAVAVVDSGIDERHPGLRGRVADAVRVDGDGVRRAAGDRDGHGTHIAGVVAGDGSGSLGQRHAGMAPRAELVAVDISGSFTTTNAVRAFQWLHDHARDLGVRVVSNSWGREKEGAAYDPDDPVIRASDALVRDGLVVVFSAGNRGAQARTLTVEAQNPNVLTVGASDDRGAVEGYSSRGPAVRASGGDAPWTKPDLLAPGTDITSARAGAAQGGEAYVAMHGTSMAAPHVAGVVALVLSANPRLGPLQVKTLLLSTARDQGAAGLDPDTGAGLVDAQRAVEAARALAQGAPQAVRAPFRDEGEVAPAKGLLPGALPLDRGEVRTPIQVPGGASAVEFAVRWRDARTAFQVTLEKDGRVLGPFTGAQAVPGGMELRGRAEGLEPGAWALVARPSGAALAERYEVEGAVLTPASMPRADVPQPAAWPLFPAGLAGEAGGPPWLAVAAAAAGALGLAGLAHRARRRGV